MDESNRGHRENGEFHRSHRFLVTVSTARGQKATSRYKASRQTRKSIAEKSKEGVPKEFRFTVLEESEPSFEQAKKIENLLVTSYAPWDIHERKHYTRGRVCTVAHLYRFGHRTCTHTGETNVALPDLRFACISGESSSTQNQVRTMETEPYPFGVGFTARRVVESKMNYSLR